MSTLQTTSNSLRLTNKSRKNPLHPAPIRKPANQLAASGLHFPANSAPRPPAVLPFAFSSLLKTKKTNRPGGGASVVVAADLFPESVGGRDRCLVKGTTGSRDLSPDQGVVPDQMNGNELRSCETRRDGNLGMLKNLEKISPPYIFFVFFY
ncbi:uncharacterized protein LOC113039366 isoform X2 [Carassius auratus]|uniref:Uncharacterized protein LOC113039366 isoform X2 n=1 Tax=Carassius auratus TaxID=7957 RepID=A0A6P6IZ63_CARAU|nr:uncharacterized protein LOC113039366 isoform X2 [Carassius auratus]